MFVRTFRVDVLDVGEEGLKVVLDGTVHVPLDTSEVRFRNEEGQEGRIQGGNVANR